ncbi:hypothetical protein [Salmonirosea aquatica]|uniref:Uncharacterized protein n=1 Tax=Salmonirosea aquatica TaxID=2654236 RepID=A0A7C9FN14_9BACT|nr:hypothetical protein [Cytophagaceae bacterium SJW1-29]
MKETFLWALRLAYPYQKSIQMETFNNEQVKRSKVVAYYRIIEPRQFKDQHLELLKVEKEFMYNSELVFENSVEEEITKYIRKNYVESYQSFEVVEIIDTKDGRVLFKEPTF